MMQQVEEAEGLHNVRTYEQSAHNDLLYPITRAARFGRKDRVQSLLAAGEDANSKDWWGKTALIWAVERGDVEIARLLIENGAEDSYRYLRIEGKSDQEVVNNNSRIEGKGAIVSANEKRGLLQKISENADLVITANGKVWKLRKPLTREQIDLYVGMPAALFKEALRTDITILEFYKPDTGWKVTPTQIINQKTGVRNEIVGSVFGEKLEMPKIDVLGSPGASISTNLSFPITISTQMGFGMTPNLDIANPMVFTFNAQGELQDVFENATK